MSRYPTTALTPTELKNLTWLAGDWVGEKEGTIIEEQWSLPAGNAMMCMFRWITDEQVDFYEFVTIENEEGTLILRIKHFNPGLIGWESKEEAVSFELVQLEDQKAVFCKQESTEVLWLVYERIKSDVLIATFESEDDQTTTGPGEFRFHKR